MSEADNSYAVWPLLMIWKMFEHQSCMTYFDTCLVYLDNVIIIVSQTFRDKLENLQKVFWRF